MWKHLHTRITRIITQQLSQVSMKAVSRLVLFE
jgi:hypothetical protein